MERLSVQREVNGDGSHAVGALVAATREFADRNGLSERQGHRLCIVIEELATNAFAHGDAGQVTLDMEMMGGAVRIAMGDNGGAYDLRGYVAGDTPDSVHGGGSGIAMIRAWCEVLDYSSERGRNRIALVLRLEQ